MSLSPVKDLLIRESGSWLVVDRARASPFCPTSQKIPIISFPISKDWLAIAKLKPLSLFISLLLMLRKAFDNVKKEK